MKFDERNKKILKSLLFFISMATAAKFVLPIPIYFGLSRSTRCGCDRNNNNNNNKKQSKSSMSHKLRLGAIIIVKKKRRIAIHHPTTVGVM
jgi:hypothetical protein